MVGDWLLEGTKIGITAFAAVFIFLILCGIVFGLLGALIYAVKEENDE